MEKLQENSGRSHAQKDLATVQKPREPEHESERGQGTDQITAASRDRVFKECFHVSSDESLRDRPEAVVAG